MNERSDVDLDHVELAHDVGVGELSAEPEPRVVDEQIDVDAFAREGVEQSLRRIRICQVGRDGRRL